MLYLFADAATICGWCSEPWMQVVEDDPSKVVVRLCPVCDRWPDNFMHNSTEHFTRDEEQ